MKKLVDRRGVANQLLSIIRREQQRRRRRAAALDREGYDWAIEQYLFEDEPFLNDVCLMLVVAIWHEVEREIVGLAARLTADGQPLTGKEYHRRLRAERERFRTNRAQVIRALGLRAFPAWDGEMRTLQLLANCYKHDPRRLPDKKLLEQLKLRRIPQHRPRVDYAPLPESQYFREGLARSLGLEKSVDYLQIVIHLLARANAFIVEVEQQDRISRVRLGVVSMTRFVG